MSEEQTYGEAEAHRPFAIQCHGQTWDLLDKEERSPEEDELMTRTAHASCRHCGDVGAGLHHQRGEWLISRVYAALELAGASLRHAKRCGELTETHAELMEDFDRAFGCECLARVNALAGEQDKEYFFSDLNGGNWNGLR